MVLVSVLFGFVVMVMELLFLEWVLLVLFNIVGLICLLVWMILLLL